MRPADRHPKGRAVFPRTARSLIAGKYPLLQGTIGARTLLWQTDATNSVNL